jgi:hypothetical protein
MRISTKALAGIGLVAASLAFSPFALADLVEMDTTGDGTYNVTGFTQLDWEAPGNVVFENALPAAASTGDTTLADFFASDTPDSTVTFNLYYQARLVAFTGATGPDTPGDLTNEGTPGSCVNGSGCYEVTIALTATESATLTSTLGVEGYQELTFNNPISGTFEGFIDDNPDAVPTNGPGYINGTQFMTGTLQSVTGSFIGVGSSDPSGFNTIGTITAADYDILREVDLGPVVGSQFRTNVSFFGDPGTEAIQVGDSIGVPAQYTVVEGDLIRQADANQPLFSAPEPGSLLLLGAGLLGFGGLRRKLA